MVGVSRFVELPEPSLSLLKNDGWLLNERSERSLPNVAVDVNGSFCWFSRDLAGRSSVDCNWIADGLQYSSISADGLKMLLTRKLTPMKSESDSNTWAEFKVPV